MTRWQASSLSSGGRLLGVASLDPTVLGREAALAELRRSVRELGLRGLNLDAGFYATALRADADILMPLYEECLRLGVPALVMSGPTTPDLALNDPFAVDVVARTFPKLPIVCCHGFYPRVADMVAVAFRNENVLRLARHVLSPGRSMSRPPTASCRTSSCSARPTHSGSWPRVRPTSVPSVSARRLWRR